MGWCLVSTEQRGLRSGATNALQGFVNDLALRDAHSPAFVCFASRRSLLQASLSTVYVRAKRERATYFLEAQKSDRVDVLRRTLAAILEREPEQIRLRNMDKTELNLNRTLEEARLEDGSAVRFDYLLPDGSTRSVHHAAQASAPPLTPLWLRLLWAARRCSVGERRDRSAAGVRPGRGRRRRRGHRDRAAIHRDHGGRGSAVSAVPTTATHALYN